MWDDCDHKHQRHRSQGSWQHPSVRHPARSLRSAQSLSASLLFLWQPQLSPCHSNKRPDHIPRQAPWLIRTITHSRGCPGVARVCEIDWSHPWLLRSPLQDFHHPDPTQQRDNYMKMDFGCKITNKHCVWNSSGFRGPRFEVWPLLCLGWAVWPRVSHWRSLGLLSPPLSEAKGVCLASPSCYEDYSWNFVYSVDYHLWLFAG